MLPAFGPVWFRRLTIASLVSECAIILSGAAVRLTGSGLGCADWPTCSKGNLTPPLRYHSVIEFGNRTVTILLVAIVAATLIAALQRRPFRRDLAWLSGGLVIGVLVEAVIGGIVVYSKLNPYLVMVHFVLTMLLVVDAAVLVHRESRDYSPGTGRLLVPRPILLLSKGMIAFVAVVVVAGAATTGTAPDGGGAVGQVVAPRIPFALRSMAELHATLALFLVGVVISLAVALHALDVPEKVRRGARMLVVVLVFQAAVGYAQYFTHLPAALVELHELGATAIVVGAVQYFLYLTHHPATRATDAVPVGAPARALTGAGVGGPTAMQSSAHAPSAGEREPGPPW